MCDDFLPAIGLRGGGVECTGRPCAFVGKGTAEDIGVKFDGHIERANGDQAVQCIPVSEEAPLLGQSFLGERLLR